MDGTLGEEWRANLSIFMEQGPEGLRSTKVGMEGAEADAEATPSWAWMRASYAFLVRCCDDAIRHKHAPVSYTHLTLPTIYSV